MELIRKSWATRGKDLVDKILQDNLFLLSSSISYYSAVSIAPFLLILLSVASLIGEEVQYEVTNLAGSVSPEVGQMVSLIFQNVNKVMDLGTTSGLIGISILFITASFVFLQMRYAFDVIYGYHETRGRKNIWEQILDKLFAIFVVFLAGAFLIVSSSLPKILKMLFPGQGHETFASAINLCIYIVMFWAIHFVTPSERPGKREALRMAILSSFFFIFGNQLLDIYFRTMATSSIYGAAGTLLIFLVWAYYSSFTTFLSAEIFLFLKQISKIKE